MKRYRVTLLGEDPSGSDTSIKYPTYVVKAESEEQAWDRGKNLIGYQGYISGYGTLEFEVWSVELAEES